MLRSRWAALGPVAICCKGLWKSPVAQSHASRLAYSFVPSRSYSVAEPPLTYTVFDSTGRVAAVAAQMPRKRFLRENGLNSRDLRHIDGQAAIVPRILVHRGNILVNITDLRVLIQRGRVLVFASKDPRVAERLSMLIYDFQAKFSGRQIDGGCDDGQMYEQRALETVLIHAIAFLEVELSSVMRGVRKVLADLEERVDRPQLYDLLVGARSLDAFHRQALAVRNALDDAMDDVEGVAKMYLSGTGNQVHDTDKHNIELLLETYFKQADELVQKARLAARDVATTGEIVNMMIDSNRNSLMLFRLKTSIATVSFALALFVADMYGMNLENWIEETNWGMPLVSSVVLFIAIIGTRYNMRKLQLAKRVHMTGIVNPADSGGRSVAWNWLEKTNSPNRRS